MFHDFKLFFTENPPSTKVHHAVIIKQKKNTHLNDIFIISLQDLCFGAVVVIY